MARHVYVVLALTHVAGPLGLLATRAGWRSEPWRCTAFLAGLSWVIGAATWHLVPRALAWHPIAILSWPLLTLIVATAGSLAWARGVRWAQEEAPILRVPRGLRHPLTGGLLGLFAPGFAHTLMDQPRRAVGILACTGPLGACVLITLRGPALWASHAAHGAPFGFRALELGLIACGIGALVAAVGWLLQVLDGMHTTSLVRGRREPLLDALAAVLVVALTAFAAGERTRAAEALDVVARQTERAGLERLPLWCWQVAASLDEGQPVYAVRAARRHVASGETDQAERILAELEARWARYREEVEPRLRRPDILADRPSRPSPSGAVEVY